MELVTKFNLRLGDVIFSADQLDECARQPNPLPISSWPIERAQHLAAIIVGSGVRNKTAGRAVFMLPAIGQLALNFDRAGNPSQRVLGGAAEA